jgi:hypothetical protein
MPAKTVPIPHSDLAAAAEGNDRHAAAATT